MRIVIWDIWTRLFHWSLVLCVAFLLFSGKTGNGFFDWHRYIGEGVAGLILFRLCWGLWGSSNARLGGLFSNPVKALSHIGHLFKRILPPERGHNAAGGWASVAMIVLIAIQAVSGLFIADEDELLEGVFYGDISGAWTEKLLEVHYLNSSVILALVIVHILMIIIYRIWGKVNLLFPMISGRMSWPESHPVPDLKIQHWAVGLMTALAVLSIVALGLGWIV